MAWFTAKRMDQLLKRHRGPLPRIFVESGTWQGGTTRLALERFQEVHTIELSPELAAAHHPALAAAGAKCHQGDSRKIVPELAKSLTAPVCWYLDAHWTDKCAGAMPGPLPLWDELKAISRRTFRDIIVVDDVHSFGTHRAALLKTQPSRADFFKKQPEWNQVSLVTIARYFRQRRQALIMGDQAVIYR